MGKPHPREKLKPLTLRTAGPGRHADGEGLYMLVDATGGRRWLLRTLIRGKRCDIGLGTVRYGDDELKKIRATARELRDIARKGGDPLAMRRAERAKLAADQAMAKTFREVAKDLIELKRPGWKSDKHAAQWERTLEAAYDGFGDVAVQLVTVQHVVDVLKPIWIVTPETGSRLRARIAAVFDQAKALGLRTGDNPADWKGALQASLRANQAKAKLVHHAALPYASVGAFLVDLQAQQGTAARALEFTILTAARTGETIGATWSEIDFDDSTWTVPKDRMKAGKEHRVPLSKRAVALLRTLQPKDADGVLLEDELAFVFPNVRSGARMSDMAMLTVLRRMGRDDITVHGFRSTFRDWAGEQTAYPREVIEHALAHQLADAAEAAYQRGDLLRKRRALMEDWATFCATPRPAKAEVTPIRKDRAA